MKRRGQAMWSQRPARAVVMAVAAPTGPALGSGPAGPKVPVALAWGPEGLLHVALRDARRVIAVDPRTWTVADGWAVPIRPVSMALTVDRSTFLLGGIDGQVVALDTT